jgi:hypothetical protein
MGELRQRIGKLYSEHWATDGDWVTESMIMEIVEAMQKEIGGSGWTPQTHEDFTLYHILVKWLDK